MNHHITIFFLLFFMAGILTPLYGQIILKKAGMYQLHENGQTKSITVEEAKTLLSSLSESKDLYEDSRSLMTFGWISAGAAVPFVLFHGISNTEISFNPTATSTQKEKNQTFLYIGGGLLFIGVLTGITGAHIYEESINTFNQNTLKKERESHSLSISAQPGGLSIRYQF